MKRVIRSSIESKHTLIITVELNDTYFDEPIAAGQFINRVNNIKKEFQLSDDQIIAWDDFIASIRSIVLSHNFEIVTDEEHQSKKSYAYYLPFYPYTNDGEKLDLYEIEFRIANHYNNGLSDDNIVHSKNVIFKTFMVGGTRYTSQFSVLQAVRKICDELQEGNYEVLEQS